MRKKNSRKLAKFRKAKYLQICLKKRHDGIYKKTRKKELEKFKPFKISDF